MKNAETPNEMRMSRSHLVMTGRTLALEADGSTGPIVSGEIPTDGGK